MVVTPAANGNFAPYFKQKPQLKQADDGNKLIFECSLSANPQPSIEWWRGEDQLNESDGRTFFKIAPNSEADSFHVSLTLDDVVETDAGLYRVVARNSSGEVAASINLNFSRKLKKFILAYLWKVFRIAKRKILFWKICIILAKKFGLKTFQTCEFLNTNNFSDVN